MIRVTELTVSTAMGFARVLTGELTWSHTVNLAGHVIPKKHLALNVGHQIPENILLNNLLILILYLTLMFKLAFVRPDIGLEVC